MNYPNIAVMHAENWRYTRIYKILQKSTSDKIAIGGKTNIGSALPVVYLEFGAYLK